jgi:hypothetical protein
MQTTSGVYLTSKHSAHAGGLTLPSANRAAFELNPQCVDAVTRRRDLHQRVIILQNIRANRAAPRVFVPI